MALHEQSVGKSSEWYTPPHVFKAMGANFDLDTASPGPAIVPWIPANAHITYDSLSLSWRGFVWMNPPFGGRNGLEPWLERFSDHPEGVALTPDRTSAPWWQRYAPRMDLVLFVSPKIHFIPGPGARASSPAQGTTLMARGLKGKIALMRAADAGLGVLMGPA